MTHIPVQLPFKGFTEQAAFSGIPEGMTPSCLNVMPSDVWNGRTRIGTRNGTRLFSDGMVQFVGTYRVYSGNDLIENLIVVRDGLIYYGDPKGSGTLTLFGGQTGSPPNLLNATGLVEGVQFNEHFYFVDGTNYVFVALTTPAAATAVQIWGDDSPKHGPYHTDPTSPSAGERATLICRWGARLVLAGYKRTPNVWFACAPDASYPHSGAGGPTDGWTGSDYIGAVSGSTYADYGTLGDPIVAIFPFAQSGLMFGCTNSFSFLTNDPVFEEQVAMVSLTKSIGIAGRRAWCQSQEKGAFILANDGLYFINANDNNFNRGNRVSAGRLDSFFLRLDFGTPSIGGGSSLAGGTLRAVFTDRGSGSGASTTVLSGGSNSTQPTTEPVQAQANAVANFVSGLEDGEVFPCLCYDPDREGVWIFLSVNGVEKSSLHLYYDLKTDSFWPQRFYDQKLYAPTSAVYVGTSRTSSGRLMLGGSQSIGHLDRAAPVGVDGYDAEMTDEQQRSQQVRSSLTVGPIMSALPFKTMLNEVRIDMAEDRYEVPSGFNDLSEPPRLTVSTGDTAQSALGLQNDVLFTINLNKLVIDGGGVAEPTGPNYDGGGVAAPSSNRIDGRYPSRPFGTFTQNDSFAAGTSRVYTGPWQWQLRYETAIAARWEIGRMDGASWEPEYAQIEPDDATPNGQMRTTIQNPLSADDKDLADVSGASFPDAEVREIGILTEGRNTAQRCRVRSEAIYLTVAADGKPWSVERMSVQVGQVGKSRGGV